MKVYGRLAEPYLFLLNGNRYARESVLQGAIVLQVPRAIKTPRIRLSFKGKFDIRYETRSTCERYSDGHEMGRANRWDKTVTYLYTHRLGPSVEHHEVKFFPVRDIKAWHPSVPLQICLVQWPSRNSSHPRWQSCQL